MRIRTNGITRQDATDVSGASVQHRESLVPVSTLKQRLNRTNITFVENGPEADTTGAGPDRKAHGQSSAIMLGTEQGKTLIRCDSNVCL